MKGATFLLLLLTSNLFAQKNYEANFITSFDYIDAVGVVDLSKFIQAGKKMSIQEAMNNIYSGDSSKIYCNEKIVNMENEGESKVVRKEYLPEKCFLIEYENFKLLGYAVYIAATVGK
jgi:hypothetical protein